MKKVLFLIIVMVAFVEKASAQHEYKYHPIFIYNFSRYIEWPATTHTNQDFVICVVGSKEAYEQMLHVAQKKNQIKTQKIVVKHCPDLSHVGESNIIFITKHAHTKSQEIHSKLNIPGTLIITEQSRTNQGGHINFVTTSDSKIGFELNTTATQNAGFKVANALVQLAAKAY